MFLASPHSMQDLSSPNLGLDLRPSTMEKQSPNNWIIRKSSLWVSCEKKRLKNLKEIFMKQAFLWPALASPRSVSLNSDLCFPHRHR